MTIPGRKPAPRPRPAAGDKPARKSTYKPAGKPDSGPARGERTPRRDGNKPAGGGAGGRPPQREGKPAFAAGSRPPRREKILAPVAPKTDGKRRPEGFDPRRMKPDKGHIWIPGPNARTIRAEAGQDLAHYLVSQATASMSVRKAREYLEDACCRINGKIETFGSYQLKIGDIVEFLLPEEEHEHKFDERRILHNDRALLAYDKPPHLAVTPQDGPKSWSLFDILKASPIGKETPLFPVHRLDADTSGIVLFAKDPTTAGRMEAFFRDHQVEKTYHGIVRGHPREEGSHRSYLVKVASRKGFEQWKSGRGADAREAITNWVVEERLGKYGSLVKIQPKTGRYHQIRIHFSELGYQLYGDRVYGDRLDPVHVHRHMLHASEVYFANPSSGPALRIISPLPRDFVQAMDRLRKI